jgi:hypothetical protein
MQRTAESGENIMQNEPNWNNPKGQPAPRALWHLINANFPTTRNKGVWVFRTVKKTNALSHHDEGRALDIGINPQDKYIGDRLFHFL